MDRWRIPILGSMVFVALVSARSVASADEPHMEVHSTQTRCEQSWEVTATGLERFKPVLVAFTFGGTASPGAVGGTSDGLGQFFSPIPRVLLPCVEGGKVTASITVDGKLLPITAHFEIAAPGAPPTAPGVGNSAPSTGNGSPARMLLAAGAGLVLVAGGMALSQRRRRGSSFASG